MADSDELIDHAFVLAGLNLQSVPNQVDLRRAVSAAYYALFHLLTTQAAGNWKNESQRHRFARMFEHGRMKQCSTKVMTRSDEPKDPIAANLKVVASGLLTLQESRNTADYDNARVWSRDEATEAILQAQDAMAAWTAIRQTEMAQDYLLNLMGTR
jgi:uncharacterized protein (UPF0332 family)